MSLANSKKSSSSSSSAWVGAMARIRRGGTASRQGRRAALLNVMTSLYANANSSRGNEGRGSSPSTER